MSGFKSLPVFFSKQMKEVYSNVSINDPDAESASQPDLDKEEDAPLNGTQSTRKHGSIRQLAFIFCLSILITIVVTSAIMSTKVAVCHKSPSTTPATSTEPFGRPPPSMSTLKPKSCGHNSTTARANGCHFDIMSMIWIPHECYDPELTAEFSGLKDWEWSRHENGTDLIPKEEILKGDIPHGYVRFEYHLTHCLYTWMKLNRQVERGGGPIDGYISNSTHTHHCSKMLELRDISAKEWNTPFIVLYPTCYV